MAELAQHCLLHPGGTSKVCLMFRTKDKGVRLALGTSWTVCDTTGGLEEAEGNWKMFDSARSPFSVWLSKGETVMVSISVAVNLC